MWLWGREERKKKNHSPLSYGLLNPHFEFLYTSLTTCSDLFNLKYSYIGTHHRVRVASTTRIVIDRQLTNSPHLNTTQPAYLLVLHSFYHIYNRHDVVHKHWQHFLTSTKLRATLEKKVRKPHSE